MAKKSLVGSFVPDDASTSSESSGATTSSPQPTNTSLVGSFTPDEDVAPQEVIAPKAKQYKDTSASDVAKSLGSGAELGVAQLAGLPGDVLRAGRWLKEEGQYYGTKAAENAGYAEPGTADKNWQDVEAARESPDRDYVGYVPTSEALTKLAKEYVPGANYEPESRGGAYAHTIGEVVPAFFGGEGSLVKKLGTAAIAGGASEAAGQATEGTPYEGVARLGGMLVAPTAASKLSRPLGAAGSFLGVGDETLGSVGLTSDTQAAYNKVVAEGQRLKSIGAWRGLSDQDIQTVLENERANGVAPQDSVIHSWSALSDSPTDVINRFVKNSLANPKVRNSVEDMYANAGRAADQADVAASGMFQDMHNESAINAINAQRRAHGVNDDIVEAPTADQLRATADEVRKGAWQREVQPIFDNHPSVDSSTLSSMLPLVEPKIVEQVKRNYNVIRQTRDQQPFEFLTQRTDGQYTTSGQGAAAYSTPFYQNLARKAGESDGVPKGAPLEFWDMLSNELQASQNKAHNIVGSQIKEGIDQYFTSKNLPNQLQEAKQSFRNIRGEGNALDAGMQFVNQGAYQTNPAKRAAFLNRWEKMSDVEKGLYQTGVMQQAFSTLAQGAKGTINWDGVLQNRNNRQLLEKILNFRPEGTPAQVGPANFDKFNSALRVAKAFKRESASNVLANAPESRGFLSRLLGVGENSLVDVAVKSLYRGAYSPGAGYITALTGGFGYIRQVLADRQAVKMMEMFNSKNPNLAIQLARDIASSKQAQTSWQKVESLLDFTNKATINFYRRAAIATNNQQTQQPIQRSTGGRIPEVDKMFKKAKKALDDGTKPMLHMHDDAIVNALRVAQGRM
jgi:hypothetical protein